MRAIYSILDMRFNCKQMYFTIICENSLIGLIFSNFWSLTMTYDI